MKEITAIVRMNRMGATQDALETAGFVSLTAQKVMGRGKQKGLVGEFTHPVPLPEEGDLPAPAFIPKRMITLIVDNDQVGEVVSVITKANRTGQPGDGKIFVSPLKRLSRIRTGETGLEAI